MMTHTFDEIEEAMRNCEDWDVPQEKKNKDAAGAAMVLLRL